MNALETLDEGEYRELKEELDNLLHEDNYSYDEIKEIFIKYGLEADYFIEYFKDLLL